MTATESNDQKRVSVGVIGTSWWADAMYLPALTNHPQADITAICGRRAEPANKMAQRWQIPHVFTEYEEMIESGLLDAILVLSGNENHYPATMKALEADLHTLCEKPLAMTYPEAAEMAQLAEAKNLKNMVPFTYCYMPTARYMISLLEEGYIGQPYHLNLRYYTGYGRDTAYNWRFDMGKAGSGAIGDIGSHFLYLATRFFGKIEGIHCKCGQLMERPATDPDGNLYEQAEEMAIMTVAFENGAQGVIHITTLAYEDTPFGQTHHVELHGSEGTLYSIIDWDKVQRVSGARQGEGAIRELPIPDQIWGNARRDTVHNTYRDIFREQDWMTREFITAILAEDSGQPTYPTFRDGATIQQLIEAALQSDKEGRWVAVKNRIT